MLSQSEMSGLFSLSNFKINPGLHILVVSWLINWCPQLFNNSNSTDQQENDWTVLIIAVKYFGTVGQTEGHFKSQRPTEWKMKVEEEEWFEISESVKSIFCFKKQNFCKWRNKTETELLIIDYQATQSWKGRLIKQLVYRQKIN